MINQTYSQTFIEPSELIETIETIINGCLQINICARLTFDSKLIAPYRVFLTIPQEPEKKTIISNLVTLLELTITPYISKARPGDVLFNAKTAIRSPYFEHLVKAETNKAFKMIEVRKDLAGRILNRFEPVREIENPAPQLTQFLDTIQKVLDIHLGFKLFFQGNDFIDNQLFLPVISGNSIVSAWSKIRLWDIIPVIRGHVTIWYLSF